MADGSATETSGLTPLRGGIAILGLTTAIIHIVLAVPSTLVGFYVNGLGYIGLTAALLIPRLGPYRRQIRWLMMGYTAPTILLWVVLGRPYTTIGYVDKAIEVALLGLLWLDQRQSARHAGRSHLVDTAC